MTIIPDHHWFTADSAKSTEDLLRPINSLAMEVERDDEAEFVVEASETGYRRYYTAMTHPARTASDVSMAKAVATWWQKEGERDGQYQQVCGA